MTIHITAEILQSAGVFLAGFTAFLGLLWRWPKFRRLVDAFKDKHAILVERDIAAAARNMAISEAAAAHRSATGWRAAYDATTARLDDLESRVLPRFAAAIQYIRELMHYIERLDQALSPRPIGMIMPPVPPEISEEV